MDSGIVIRGLYIGYKERFRDGKQDGYNISIACGVDAYKIKVPSDVFERAQVGAAALGDPVEASVAVRVFRDQAYFSADALHFLRAE